MKQVVVSKKKDESEPTTCRSDIGGGEDVRSPTPSKVGYSLLLRFRYQAVRQNKIPTTADNRLPRVTAAPTQSLKYLPISTPTSSPFCDPNRTCWRSSSCYARLRNSSRLGIQYPVRSPAKPLYSTLPTYLCLNRRKYQVAEPSGPTQLPHGSACEAQRTKRNGLRSLC